MVNPYPIPITTIPLERQAPQIVPAATIQEWARLTGNPRAQGQDVAGITVPSILVDPSGLRDEQRVRGRAREFRYRSGTLTLYLRLRIFINRGLSPCEQRIWTTHEMDHVRDYEQLMGTLNLRLQSDSFMRAFFLDRQWFPVNDRGLMMDSIRETCAGIFRQLTQDAVTGRDTDAEYERVRSQIRETCHGRSRRPSLRPSARPSG
ncbi:MAG: hypothetical protein HY885_09080 [Deltaproteobacteria bacterium]|nr:hypothetical protein [Deltaproteobacteria bacterium]